MSCKRNSNNIALVDRGIILHDSIFELHEVKNLSFCSSSQLAMQSLLLNNWLEKVFLAVIEMKKKKMTTSS